MTILNQSKSALLFPKCTQYTQFLCLNCLLGIILMQLLCFTVNALIPINTLINAYVQYMCVLRAFIAAFLCMQGTWLWGCMSTLHWNLSTSEEVNSKAGFQAEVCHSTHQQETLKNSVWVWGDGTIVEVGGGEHWSITTPNLQAQSHLYRDWACKLTVPFTHIQSCIFC